MNTILLTGATGYIGQRILPLLLAKDYRIICLVRDKYRFKHPEQERIELVECDFLNSEEVDGILQNEKVDYAYYLMHSMSATTRDFERLEMDVTRNFVRLANRLYVKQVVYLTGMYNEHDLSPHLQSRKNVEKLLATGQYALTSIRAGIIIGSGSASFELIRDLVEKLPIIVGPSWLNTKCQPIAVRDILKVLVKVVGKKETYNMNFDVGGPNILTYREMLLGYAKVRKLRRFVYVSSLLSARFSSYWLYLLTSVPYPLAQNLVDSMHIDFVARNNKLLELLKIKPIRYQKAIHYAFDKIKQNEVLSSWRDSIGTNRISSRMEKYIQVPTQGCLKDRKCADITDRTKVIAQLWEIGRSRKWYYGYQLWMLRGFMDRIAGGVGFRRHRNASNVIYPGDSIDFWRVIIANRHQGRLLLYAEMKVPGEAWLEFRLKGNKLCQTATFRPKGLGGRFYWYGLLPIHKVMFKGMVKKIIRSSEYEERKNKRKK